MPGAVTSISPTRSWAMPRETLCSFPARACRASGTSSRSKRKAGASEAPLRLLRVGDGPADRIRRRGARPGDGAPRPGARPRLRRWVRRAHGNHRGRRPCRRRRGDRRAAEGPRAEGAGPRRPHRAPHRGLDARAQGADGLAGGRLRGAAGRPRHARGDPRGPHVGAARHPPEARGPGGRRGLLDGARRAPPARRRGRLRPARVRGASSWSSPLPRRSWTASRGGGRRSPRPSGSTRPRPDRA